MVGVVFMVVSSEFGTRERVGARAGSVVELLFLGRSDEGEGCAVGVQRGGDLVEVPGADLALVARGGVPGCLRGEFGLLEFDVGAHVPLVVVLGDVGAWVVEGVEAREGDELERVAHRGELALELRDLVVVEWRFQLNDGEPVVAQASPGTSCTASAKRRARSRSGSATR